MKQRHSQRLLDWGFAIALFMAVVLMFSGAAFLLIYQLGETKSINDLLDSGLTDAALANSGAIRLAHAGLVFNSCGLFVGWAIAFLGFAMFLADARGSIDASADVVGRKVELRNAPPGVITVVCATAIVITCMLQRPDLSLASGPEGAGAWKTAASASDWEAPVGWQVDAQAVPSGQIDSEAAPAPVSGDADAEGEY